MLRSDWMTEALAEEIRQVFESRYGRSLSDEEVYEIADNLTKYIELIIQYPSKIRYK